MTPPLIGIQMREDIVNWRRDLHAHPELLYDVHHPAGFAASKLQDLGATRLSPESAKAVSLARSAASQPRRDA
jgi:metal-dependent amidase/aminoacylase/carboxypeptidase family protein